MTMEVYRTVDPPRVLADESAGALDEQAAAAFLGCSPRHLLELRKAGKAPPFYRMGNRVRYPRHLLVAWMNTAVLEPVVVWPRRRSEDEQVEGGVA